MLQIHAAAVLMSFALVSCGPAKASDALSDQQVRQAIIRESLASYPGNCPCPYNVDRRGHSCGRRSAYSRPGGYSPICYDTDVTQKMIQAYRAAHSR